MICHFVGMISPIPRHRVRPTKPREPGYAESRHLIYLTDHAIPGHGQRNDGQASTSSEADPNCCITLLPEGADTTCAWLRFLADDASRKAVEDKLAQRESDTDAKKDRVICRLCKALTRLKWRHAYYWMHSLMDLPDDVDEIVWHMRSK